MSRKSEHMRESELKDYERRYYECLKKGDYRLKISASRYRCPFCRDSYKEDYSLRELLRHASQGSRSGGSKEKAKHSALQRFIERYLDVDKTSEPVAREFPKPASDQSFVSPWMGIVANIATEFKNGRYVGEGGSKLKDFFTSKAFHPLKVHPLWNRSGHSGFAIVEFRKNWEGFSDAMNFEKSFEVEHCGKKDYIYSKHPGKKLYGWVARNDDYHAEDIVGAHLRRNGDLKTLTEKEAEEKRMTSMLVLDLANTLEIKNKQLNQVKSNYESLNMLMAQEEEMMKSFNDELKEILQSDRDHFEKIFRDHENVKLHLESQKKELENREKDLQKRLAHNEHEKKKLYLEKKKNEIATREQKKADEKVMRLAEEQKKEKEELHKKIHELQRKIDAKQTLELEIEQMRGALQVMKHMGEDEDVEAKKKFDAVKLDLQEKEEELEAMEELNQALIVKERRTNDELQDARKEYINKIERVSARANIRVKKMGDLELKPFVEATKRKFSDEAKGMELCSLWDAYIRDSSWHPFKITVDKVGNAKETIDQEDEKLRALKDEFGDEVFGAVATALMEMNEYNPSGRYPVPELWNFTERRKASLQEAASHLVKLYKRNRKN